LSDKVSVIIPVHNGERYLADAIESVLSQTYPCFEIIVVDNGSQDRSRAIAESFEAAVRVLYEPEPSAGRARNAGIRAASGDLVAFLDADDLWASTKLTRQIELFSSQPDTDAVFTNLEEFVSPELPAEVASHLSCRPGQHAGWIPSTMLARRSCFDAVGLLPEIAIGEFIAWFGMARAAGLNLRMVAEPLVRRRVHLSNTTRQRDLGGYLKAAKVLLDSRRAKGMTQG
jgi:glycosyltransferase involved in cell wall biosynthesis